MMKMPKPKPVVRWMKLAPMLSRAEARGALDETRADAQQKYGENNATHLYYQVFHWVTTPLVIIHVLEADRGV